MLCYPRGSLFSPFACLSDIIAALQPVCDHAITHSNMLIDPGLGTPSAVVL